MIKLLTIILNIKTHSNGFTVQEQYTVRQCNLKNIARKELQDRFPDMIGPDPGKEYVLQAQGTVEVAFNPGQPSMGYKVINQGISYGNSFVQSKADKRNWLEKFVDYFKTIFGANSVPNIAHSEEQASEETPELRKPLLG